MSRAVMQQALEALIPLANANCPNERECLTDEDHERAAEAVEALEQALAEPEQPTGKESLLVQQPVAWISEGGDVSRSKRYMDEMGFKCEPLYTTPTPRKPLTDEEILKAVGWDRAEMYMKLTPNFPVAEAKKETLKNARAIERKHGITGETK